MASRVDPNYIGGPAPQLISHGDDDSEFVESLDSDGHDKFDVALEWMECGESTKASKAIRALLKRFPYHIAGDFRRILFGSTSVVLSRTRLQYKLSKRGFGGHRSDA